MSRNRIEIETVENGFEVTVWKPEEEKDEKTDFGYTEPKKYVAQDKKEAMKIFEENF